MDGWVARALDSATNYIRENAVVGQGALRCNRWIASSALQKAIRRGEITTAIRAALALHREDRPGAWRRLIAIAFEDVGAADIDAVVETVAIATSPEWRAKHGEERVLASVASHLAEAPKDRSADYLMWAAAEHRCLADARDLFVRASIQERLSILLDGSAPLGRRAVAAWFASGIDYPYQRRMGAGDLLALAEAYRQLGATDQLASATVVAAKRTREPYTVLLPLTWLEVQGSERIEVRDEPVPASAMVAGVPLYALDEHTRLGKRAINTLARENAAIRACLQQFVSKRRWIAAAQHAAFYAEGSAVARRLA